MKERQDPNGMKIERESLEHIGRMLTDYAYAEQQIKLDGDRNQTPKETHQNEQTDQPKT